MAEEQQITARARLEDDKNPSRETLLLAKVASLEAKLDEREKDLEDAKRCALRREALLVEIKAKSEHDLKEAKKLVDERKVLLDEIKLNSTTFTRGLRPTLMTRGVAASLAKSLDGARPDFVTGMRKHDEILHNFDLIIHEPPQVVLEALLGNR